MMKKLLKLVVLEASYFKRTLIVIFIILTTFGAAFMAVVSLMLDTPQGTLAGIDSSKKYYCDLYGGECLALEAKSQTVDIARQYSAELCYGTLKGITFDADLQHGTSSFPTDIVVTLGSGAHKLEYRVERHGYFVPVEFASRLQFLFLTGDDCGVWLCSEIAEELDVNEGETVSLGEKQLKVLGIFDKEGVIHNYDVEETVLPAAWFYVVDSASSVVFDELYFTYAHSQAIFGSWQRSGRQLGLSDVLTQWHDDIALVQTYYGYLAILLGALVLFLLYALFTLFFRARKPQICRFELMGATGATVALIYIVIALALIVCATVLASAVSVLLSKYLLNVYTRLFNVVYPYSFRVWLPLSFLGVSVLVTSVSFALLKKRIERLPVAQEVRYE